jgi:hypothetical protein
MGETADGPDGPLRASPSGVVGLGEAVGLGASSGRSAAWRTLPFSRFASVADTPSSPLHKLTTSVFDDSSLADSLSYIAATGQVADLW